MKKKPTSQLLFDTPGWTIPKENINLEKKSKRKKKNNNQGTTEQQPTSSRPSQTSEQEKVHSPNPKRIKNSHPTLNKQHQLVASQLPNETTDLSVTHQLAQGLLNSNLSGSRFRILNETLYTSSGPEALKLFQCQPTHATDEGGGGEENPNFSIYHLGFRSQTKHWPQNPVDLIAHDLQVDPQLLKIPGSILVADLGCGEAPLAKLLCPSSSSKSSQKKHTKSSLLTDPNRFKVFSYDLVADVQGWITVAECSTLVPLPGSLDDRIGNGMMLF